MSHAGADSLERWCEPLTADERAALLNTVATAVRRRGLQTPALFFLEMNRPLGFLASQGLIAFAPFLAPLLGIDRLQQLGRLLADPLAVDELVTWLERPHPPTPSPGAAGEGEPEGFPVSSPPLPQRRERGLGGEG